jgi:hypothetical protein
VEELSKYSFKDTVTTKLSVIVKGLSGNKKLTSQIAGPGFSSSMLLFEPVIIIVIFKNSSAVLAKDKKEFETNS